MSKRISWEARAIEFFETAPLPVAQAILEIAKAKVRARQPSTTTNQKPKRNRKQKEMFPEQPTQ